MVLVIVIVESRVGGPFFSRFMLPIRGNSTLLMDILIIWCNIVKEVPTTVLPMRMTILKELKKKVIQSANNFKIVASIFIKNKECQPS